MTTPEQLPFRLDGQCALITGGSSGLAHLLQYQNVRL
jgi:hypothetical protein